MPTANDRNGLPGIISTDTTIDDTKPDAFHDTTIDLRDRQEQNQQHPHQLQRGKRRCHLAGAADADAG